MDLHHDSSCDVGVAGADPVKLQDQIVRFGKGVAGMPPPLVYRGSDGELIVYDVDPHKTRRPPAHDRG